MGWTAVNGVGGSSGGPLEGASGDNFAVAAFSLWEPIRFRPKWRQRRRTRDDEVERPRMRWQAETDRLGHGRDLSARVFLPARIGPYPTRRKAAIHPRRYLTRRCVVSVLEPLCGLADIAKSRYLLRGRVRSAAALVLAYTTACCLVLTIFRAVVVKDPREEEGSLGATSVVAKASPLWPCLLL
ncbi:hypothetical protein ZIOFF_065278 [Zingiber officinale]|uniref:Uncharacterized protein n=1 Tax=Zingiber officinale TaxID=94328 RepID=A0A8J5KD23_ZINOF|nr:hypothetical protein ZIOFF_065278 [Zingiber officinale]